MANEGVLRGLSLAMTIQNTAIRGSSSGHVNLPPFKIGGSTVYHTEDGCFSGFTASGSNIVPLNDNPSSSSDAPTIQFSENYEIQAKVFISADMSRDQVLWGSQVTPYYAVPSVELQGSGAGDNHAIWSGHTSVSGGWLNQIRIAREDFDPIGAWSYIRQSYSNGTYMLKASHDGVRWVSSSAENVGPFYKDSVGEFGFGNLTLGSMSANNVTFDLTKTYIKINGVPIWGAGY